MTKKTYVLLALVCAMTFTATANAQMLDVGLDTSVMSSSSDTLLDASTNTTVETTPTTVGTAGTLDFSFSRDTLDTNTDYSVTESAEVRSAAGLESYLGASVQNDERLEAIAITENRMELTYKRDGRLLWIIPVQMKTDVAVDASGDVSVSYPWYSFLVSTSETQTALEARLDNEIRSIETSIEAQTEASQTSQAGVQTGDPEVRRWARILESLHLALSMGATV